MDCPLCRSSDVTLLAEISRRPEVEIDYKIPENLYFRKIYQCQDCSVYFNSHDLIDFTSFYGGHYNQSITPTQSIDARFNRIINIPFELSDNKQRVKRIIEKLQKEYPDNKTPKVLDVGSGTCVFLYELLKNLSIDAFCIDPDNASIDHVSKNIPQITAQAGTIADISSEQKFDLITFNKVLEHVIDPINELSSTKRILHPSGIIYLELPFGDDIARNHSFSENAEFNVEHITIYNIRSVEYLAIRAGFKTIEIETVMDPSGKHTIYAFLKIK